jgi:hypothetical protein
MLEEEVGALKRWLRLAAEAAIIEGRPIGVHFYSAGGRLWVRRTMAWHPVTDPSIANFDLPAGVRLLLERDDAQLPLSDDVREGRPQVVFLSTGEVSPSFRAALKAVGTDQLTVLNAHENGTMAIEIRTGR